MACDSQCSSGKNISSSSSSSSSDTGGEGTAEVVVAMASMHMHMIDHSRNALITQDSSHAPLHQMHTLVLSHNLLPAVLVMPCK